MAPHPILKKIARVVLGAAVAAVFVLPLFVDVLFNGKLFPCISGVNYYHIFFFAAQKHLIFDLHQWPYWWTPYYSGYPISLTLNGFLNPVFILALRFFPVLPAYHWLTFGFFVLNIVSTFAFGRALKMTRVAAALTALTYGLSGIIMTWTDVIVFTALFPLLPLVFLACIKIHRGSRIWWWILLALLVYGWIAGFTELLIYDLIALAGFCLFLVVGDPEHMRTWRHHPIAAMGAMIGDGTKKFLTPVLLSILLVSPWLMTVSHFVTRYSNRGLDASINDGASLSLSQVIHLFLPRLSVYHGSIIPVVQLGNNIELFIGTLPFLLLLTLPLTWASIRSRERWFFLGLLVFAFLMLFRSPLYVFVHQLPVLRWFRWHFKWTFLTVFAASVLVGYATDSFPAFRQHRYAKKLLTALWVAASLIILALTVITIASQPIAQRISALGISKYRHAAEQSGRVLQRSPDYYTEIVKGISESLVREFSWRAPWTLLSAILWLVALIAITYTGKKPLPWRTRRLLFVVIAGGGSIMLLMGILTGPSDAFLKEPPATAAYIRSQNAYRQPPISGDAAPTPYRIFTYVPEPTASFLQETYHVDLIDLGNWMILRRELLTDNINTWFGLDGASNIEPLADARIVGATELVSSRVIAPRTLDEELASYSSEPKARLLGRMNVKYVISPLPLTSPWKPVFTSHVFGKIPVTVYENPFFLPRWYFADRITWVDNPGHDAAVGTRALDLASSEASTTVLETQFGNDRALAAQPDPDDRISLITYTEGRLDVTTKTKNARWLVFSETGAPFWHAQIDDLDVPTYQANDAYQAVLVPPGTHHVRFFTLDFWGRTKESIRALFE